MGAQNLNFACGFSQMGVFSPKFCILDEYSDKKKIFRQPKI